MLWLDYAQWSGWGLHFINYDAASKELRKTSWQVRREPSQWQSKRVSQAQNKCYVARPWWPLKAKEHELKPSTSI
jgi:hypothetical protein